MRVKHLQIAIDGRDVDRLADFWVEALGYVRHGQFEQYRSLVDPDERGPKLILQEVPEGWSAKSRTHIDLHVQDMDGEVARLEKLGAQRIDDDPVREAGTRWVRMRDIEQNEFCVVEDRD
jgi:hypothetical protein